MRLYYAPGTCALAVHITARELHLPLELVKVNLRTKQTEHQEDFYQIYPVGAVPFVVMDDGETLSEVSVIVQTLADLKPEGQLIPAHPSRTRREVLQWLSFIASDFHKSFFVFFTEGGESAKILYQGKIEKCLKRFSSQLADRNYLMGEQFMVCDAYLFTVLRWAKYLKFDLGSFPGILPYMERVESRPAVREALIKEGLIR